MSARTSSRAGSGQAVSGRSGETARAPAGSRRRDAAEHYRVTADRGHLRIFSVRQELEDRVPRSRSVVSLELPAGRRSASSRDTDMAGRFPGSGRKASGKNRAAAGHGGMSIDERLSMGREEDRRRVKEIAGAIDDFLDEHPAATWELAAGPAIKRRITEQLTTQVLARLQRVRSKTIAR